MKDYYALCAEDYHAATFSLDPSRFLSVLTNHLPTGSKILDVGCGSGRDLLWLKQRGYLVWGLERSPGLVRLARRDTGCEVVEGDFNNFAFTTHHVHSVLAVGTLVHTPPERFAAALGRILECLGPGGLLLLCQKEGVGVRKDDTRKDGMHKEGMRQDGEDRIFYLWQDQSIRPVLRSLGLTVVEFFRRDSARGTGEPWLGYVLKKSPQTPDETPGQNTSAPA